MSELRVVCYLNQFFGQIGGEDKAGVGPQVVRRRGGRRARGPAGARRRGPRRGDGGRGRQLRRRASRARAVAELLDLVAAEKPDLLVAGPAFLAGRYGVACGALCAAVQARLGVPAVTGMHRGEPRRRAVSPARLHRLDRRRGDADARRGPAARRARAQARATGARRRARGGGIFPARRSPAMSLAGASAAAQRATAMLLDKLAGRPVTSEVPLPDFPRIPAPPAVRDLEPRHHRPRHRRRDRAARQSRRDRGAGRHALRRVQHRGQGGLDPGAVRQRPSRLRHDASSSRTRIAWCPSTWRASWSRRARSASCTRPSTRPRAWPPRSRTASAWAGRSRRSCARPGWTRSSSPPPEAPALAAAQRSPRSSRRPASPPCRSRP